MNHRTERLTVRTQDLIVREIRYAAGLIQAPHSHPITTLTLVYGGALRERTRTLREDARGMSLVVKPAGTVHSDEVGRDGARTLQVAFEPRAWQRIVEEEPELDAWRWVHGGPASLELLRVLGLMRGEPDVATVEHALHDALGWLSDDGAQRTEPPAWLVRVHDAVRADFEAPPTVSELARDAGVHAVSLARAYRRCYGVSISQSIATYRAQHAAAALTGEAGGDIPGGTAQELSSLAFRLGFSDQAHFTRAFKRRTGMTPGQLRAAARH